MNINNTYTTSLWKISAICAFNLSTASMNEYWKSLMPSCTRPSCCLFHSINDALEPKGWFLPAIAAMAAVFYLTISSDATSPLQLSQSIQVSRRSKHVDVVPEVMLCFVFSASRNTLGRRAGRETLKSSQLPTKARDFQPSRRRRLTLFRENNTARHCCMQY